MQVITLDHLEGITVGENTLINELNTLQCLHAGVSALHRNLRSIEDHIASINSERRKKVYWHGFDFLEIYGLPPDYEFLTPCYFHWFSTTLCNFARLVAVFKGVEAGDFNPAMLHQSSNRKLVKTYCDKYLDSIPELTHVRKWRNKVSAHFAMTDPYDSDTSEMLQLSTMSFFEYFDNRFWARQINDFSATPEQWSLTQAYESLAPRFWPPIT